MRGCKVKLTLILGLLALIVGCGAQDPFARGTVQSGEFAQDPQKPEPIPDEKDSLEKASQEFYIAHVGPHLEQRCHACHDKPGRFPKNNSYSFALGLVDRPVGEETTLWKFVNGGDRSVHKGIAAFKAKKPEDLLVLESIQNWILLELQRQP